LNCILAIAAFFPLRLASMRSSSQRKALLKQASMPALLLVSATLIAISLPSIRDMLDTRLGANGMNSYDDERFAAHQQAMDTALSHPLGIGPGQWELSYYLSTHSLYYRVLSENGFDGLAVLVIFLLVSLYRSLRLTMNSPSDSWRNLYAVFSACLLGILLNSSVVDTLHWRHVWLLLGLIWTSQPAPNDAARSRLATSPTVPLPRPAFSVRREAGLKEGTTI